MITLIEPACVPPAPKVKENVLFDKEGKKLLFYPPGLQNDYYLIPSTVKEIEQKSFIMNDIPSLYFSNQINKLKETVDLEDKFIYKFLKSSDF